MEVLTWIRDILMNNEEGRTKPGGDQHRKYFTKLISGETCVKIEQMPHFI